MSSLAFFLRAMSRSVGVAIANESRLALVQDPSARVAFGVLVG